MQSRDTGKTLAETRALAPSAAGTFHVKDSGIGREKGRDGIRAWMAQKSIYLDLGGRPHPWAASCLRAQGNE